MIITYFLAGMCCGEFWPENPWRWGFWLTIPYGFALILLIMFNVLDGITDSAFAIVYGMIFIFIYFVSFLIRWLPTHTQNHW